MKHVILKSYRVFPSPDRKMWFWVRVFKTEEGMHAWYTKLMGGKRDFVGATLQWKLWHLRKSRWHRTGNIGEILLCSDHLKVGVITHEALHAAVWFARLSGINIANVFGRWDARLVKGVHCKSARYRDTEEKLARVIERLTAQIVTGAPLKKRV